MSPIWTLRKTSVNIPLVHWKTIQTIFPGCICHKSHSIPARKVRARSNWCNKSRTVRRDTLYIKYVYYWHTVTTASSSFTMNFTADLKISNAHIKTKIKMLLSRLAMQMSSGSARGRTRKTNTIYKMGWPHLCSSFSKRGGTIKKRKKRVKHQKEVNW